MKILKKITIKPVSNQSIYFLCTKEFFNQNIEQEEIMKEKIVDYFISLKKYKKTEENFEIELNISSSENNQQSIWHIYEIFSKAFLQKIYEEEQFDNNIAFSSPWPLYIKEHSFQKLKEKNLVFIDCETTGLYGEYLTFGLLFYNSDFSQVNAYYIYRTDIENLKNVHTFVRENVIPRINLSSLQDYGEIKLRFKQDLSLEDEKIYLSTKIVSSEKELFEESAKIFNEIIQEEKYKNKTCILADSPYPVEFLLFEKLFNIGALSSSNKNIIAEWLIDWYSVKRNFYEFIESPKYKNSIHNALVDVLINYDEYIELRGRYDERK